MPLNATAGFRSNLIFAQKRLEILAPKSMCSLQGACSLSVVSSIAVIIDLLQTSGHLPERSCDVGTTSTGVFCLVVFFFNTVDDILGNGRSTV